MDSEEIFGGKPSRALRNDLKRKKKTNLFKTAIFHFLDFQT